MGGKWSELFSTRLVRRPIQPYKEKNPIEAQLPTPLQPCNVGPLGSMDRMGLSLVKGSLMLADNF